MLIPCPLCGARDLREFTPKGAAVTLHRPDVGAGLDAWNDYLHLRDNPAGPTRELWWHGSGCGAWLVVERNTLTHEVSGARLAEEEAGA
ncbi:sarcosine oxidase subunit delta [Aliiruegeria lutimaris]|uniref:Sarcosine oxidase subunit delta n=1 Tax=Aliiruegeria lutimaris TaxID=571298 RepID=A0A1G9AV50_9RHOB|nr:sarcosine oxidase subunit delta [Aliiruegeria lutimaris]SDK31152.1 sarcosine oxidase subunit delta [Aliiruegeria lutimaris]